MDGTGEGVTNVRAIHFREGYEPDYAGSCLAIYGMKSVVTLTYCTFTESAGHAGAIYASAGTLTLYGCHFAGNTATSWAADVHYENGDVTVDNCGHGFVSEKDEEGRLQEPGLDVSKDVFGKGVLHGAPLIFFKCSPCLPGKFTESGSEFLKCDSCGPGSYAPDVGSFECYACGAGRYNGQIAAANCTACPAGTYNNTAGVIHKKDCEDCPRGSYAQTTGTDACTLCTKGRYSFAKGMVADECRSCPAQTISTFTHNACQKSVVCSTAPALFVVEGECASCDKGIALLALAACVSSVAVTVEVTRRNCDNKWTLSYVKVLLNYLQTATIVTKIDANNPDFLKVFDAMLSYPGDALRCLVNDPRVSYGTHGFVVLYLYLATLAVLVYWKDRQHRSSLKRLELETLLCLHYELFLVPCTYVCLTAFECMRDYSAVEVTGENMYDDSSVGESVLVGGGDECAGTVKATLRVLHNGVYLVMVGVMVVYTTLAIRGERMLMESTGSDVLRVDSWCYLFYVDYRPAVAWWGMVERTKKVLLLVLVYAFKRDGATQSLAVGCVCGCMLVATAVVRPTTGKRVHVWEMTSQAVVVAGAGLSYQGGAIGGACVFALFSVFLGGSCAYFYLQDGGGRREVGPVQAFTSMTMELDATIVAIPETEFDGVEQHEQWGVGTRSAVVVPTAEERGRIVEEVELVEMREQAAVL